MSPGEVDSFLAASSRALPAAPEWTVVGSRTGERRASLPVAVNGIISNVRLAITVRLQEPDYLMMGLMADRQFCRLCMTTAHRNRLTGVTTFGPHFHSWEANKPLKGSIPAELRHADDLPPEVTTKDAAFDWFLERTGIQLPRWLPVVWPHGDTLL